MAQGILRSLIAGAATVESAGLDAADGLPATQDAITAMHEIGIDLSGHSSRSVDETALSDYDLIVAMTPSIGDRLRNMGTDPAHLKRLDIPDPYGKGLEAYRVTRVHLDAALRRLFGLGA